MRVIFHELGVHRERVLNVFLEMKIQNEDTPFGTNIHAQVVGIVILLESVVVIVVVAVAVEFEMLLLLRDIIVVVIVEKVAVVVGRFCELFDSLLDAFDVQHVGHV